MRLQLPLRAGASGGPLVDRTGRAVGIVTLGGPEAAAFAVRMEAAVRALVGLAAVVAGPSRAEPLRSARAPQRADARPAPQ